MTASERDDPPKTEREAFDLHRLTLKVEASDAHRDGACTQTRMRCDGCGQLAPIEIMYGGPMADCRLCYFAWSVHHDPQLCWLRSNHFDGDAEEALVSRVLELTPLLIAARAVLDDIADTL
ncbi:hypothetical protein [Streptomyces sp. NBC_01408]|uniref:hypothetical protein n=1 Tax=Streptomyces sp. NBC_01408 TaxID=2903855 RepID=UPI00224E5A4F|nr:hypothetical protein [Streptomyces sp. NBC_01408]MCX4691051.1 hypothetical protein [Streptomyces sp. NBC_01408]